MVCQLCEDRWLQAALNWRPTLPLQRRHKCGQPRRVTAPVIRMRPSQTAPREQLARGQPVSPRRHRHKPGPAIVLRHDPVLPFQRPTAPGARRDNVKPRGLRNRRMLSHTPMSSPPQHIRQGGLPEEYEQIGHLRDQVVTISGRAETSYREIMNMPRRALTGMRIPPSPPRKRKA
jgi:hypothetical protein